MPGRLILVTSAHSSLSSSFVPRFRQKFFGGNEISHRPSMTETPSHSRPVLIMGCMQRSGTNFLTDLLVLHPDCGSSTILEDYLVVEARHLERYVTGVCSHWQPQWGLGQSEVYSALGDSLLRLLSQGIQRPRMVTKTPSVQNLPLVFKLFPQAQLLLLVRDGRAVAESGVKTFPDWTYEKATQKWTAAARTILEFDAAQPAGTGRHLIVRYEDLYRNTAPELRRIFAFLGLEASYYDFARAEALPVRGSSTFRGASQDFHWNAVAKTAEFNPLRRWEHWPRSLHERFNWVAGQYMKRFGYELVEPSRPRLLWRSWNHLKDRQWEWQARRGNRL